MNGIMDLSPLWSRISNWDACFGARRPLLQAVTDGRGKEDSGRLRLCYLITRPTGSPRIAAPAGEGRARWGAQLRKRKVRHGVD